MKRKLQTKLAAFPESLETRLALTAELLLDFNSQPIDVKPSFVSALGEETYFLTAPEQRAELWRTDGTQAGTASILTLGDPSRERQTAFDMATVPARGGKPASLVIVIEADRGTRSGPEYKFFRYEPTAVEPLSELAVTVLHRSHALGPLTIDDDGIVSFIVTCERPTCSAYASWPSLTQGQSAVASMTAFDPRNWTFAQVPSNDTAGQRPGPSTDPDEIAALLDSSRNGSSTVHSAQLLDGKVVLSLEASENDDPDDEFLAKLYVVDQQGLRPLADEHFVWGGAGRPNKPFFYRVDELYYFAAESSNDTAWEVWKTDLTPEGTVRSSFEQLTSVDPNATRLDFGFQPGTPQFIQPVFFHKNTAFPRLDTANGQFFVTATWWIDGRGLYRIDGDTAELLVELPDEPQHRPQAFAHGGFIYFYVDDDSRRQGEELWRSDGTVEGTGPVLEGTNIWDLYSEGPRLILFVNDEETGREIWSIPQDGTPQLHELIPGGRGIPFPTVLGAIDETTYIAADDGTHGRELWKLDSTGSMTLFDIRPGPVGSRPGWEAARPTRYQLDDAIYFSGDDGLHGRELWVADRDGVRLVDDIRPGPIGSSPIVLDQADDRVLFQANDGTHGRELWQLQVDELLSISTDVNGDGVTDFADFLVVSTNFGKPTAAGVVDGDFDGDGLVGQADFELLKAAFGNMSSSSVSRMVPNP